MLHQMFDLHEALRYVVRGEGSDLHLKVGSRPIARIHGRLEPIEQYELLTSDETDRVLREMLTDPEKLSEFERHGEVDFAYAVEGLARFRVNAFRQRGAVSIVARVIPFTVRTITELGLPRRPSGPRTTSAPRRRPSQRRACSRTGRRLPSLRLTAAVRAAPRHGCVGRPGAPAPRLPRHSSPPAPSSPRGLRNPVTFLTYERCHPSGYRLPPAATSCKLRRGEKWRDGWC